MSEPENQMPTPEPDTADVAQLEAETERLRQEVERLHDRPGRRQRARRIVAGILVVLTVISFAVTVPAAWGRRTTLNTDRYVATIGPLAQDPAIQEAIARRATDGVFLALDVQEVIANALPEQAVFLAAPLTDAIRGFVNDQVLRIVSSDAFAQLWVGANRFVHSQILTILDGGTETVSVREGQVFLNVLPLVNLALGQIQALATDLVGREVTLPTITADQIPAEAIAQLEAALGRDLPDDLGQIPVYDSEQLAGLQQAVRTFEKLVIILAVLTLVFLVAALWISPRRRRTLIQIAAASAVVLVIERRVAIRLTDGFIADIAAESQPAARAIVDALMGSLRRYTGWLLAIWLLVLAVALITGPYPWAVAFRRSVAGIGPALTGAVAGRVESRTTSAAWVAAHRDLLLLLGGAVAILVMLVVNLSLFWLLVFLLVVLLYCAVVLQVARGVRGSAEGRPAV